MVGGVVSLISIGPSGQSSPPQAVSRPAAVHRVIVVAIGALIVFTVEVVVLAIGIKLFPQIKTGYSLFLILSLSLSYIYVFMYIEDKFFI